MPERAAMRSSGDEAGTHTTIADAVLELVYRGRSGRRGRVGGVIEIGGRKSHSARSAMRVDVPRTIRGLTRCVGPWMPSMSFSANRSPAAATST